MKQQCVYENKKYWVQKFLNNGRIIYYVCSNKGGGYYTGCGSKERAIELADELERVMIE